MAKPVTVTVGKQPGRAQLVILNGDRTIKAALTAAGMSANGYEIRLNDEQAEETETLKANDIVTLVRPVKAA